MVAYRRGRRVSNDILLGMQTGVVVMLQLMEEAELSEAEIHRVKQRMLTNIEQEISIPAEDLIAVMVQLMKTELFEKGTFRERI